MNILFVSHYSSLYGANRSLLNLIKGLKEFSEVKNIEVICPSSGELTEELDSLGIPSHIIHFYPNSFTTSFSFYRKIKMSLRNILNAFCFFKNQHKKDYTYVYTNSSVTNFGFLLSRLFRTRHIYHLREFGDLDYNLSYTFPTLSKLLLRRSEGVVCISNAIRNHFKLPNAPVIYNGVFDKTFSKSRLSNEKILIGMVGLLHPPKGFLEVISELSQYRHEKPVEIFLIGKEGSKEYLDLCVDATTPNIKLIYKGHIPDPTKIYSLFDILIMPSKNEGLGRVTMEAMCFGIPVVGYNNAGTKELISDQKNGILYRIEDEIKNALIKIDNNYDFFSRSAYFTAEQNFLQSQYVEKIFRFIKSLQI